MGRGVPEALGVDDELRAGGESDARLARGVGAVLAEDEEAVLVVGEVEEAADDPAGAVGVQAVVVVLVQVVEAVSPYGVGCSSMTRQRPTLAPGS